MRELPDIRGVLWLERGSAELRRLDFTYHRLPFEHAEWSQVGGRVEFERLATGMWIVRRWWIRMPLVAARSGGFGGSAADLELVTLREEGAEILSVGTRDGTLMVRGAGIPGPGDQAISDMVTPDLIGGIEVYTRPSQVPPQFGGAEAASEVVVIWTRNR